MGRPGIPTSGSNRICRRLPTISITRWIVGGGSTVPPEPSLPVPHSRLKAAPSAWAATNTASTSAIRIRRHASSICCATISPGKSAELSEFYPYRYLASEGFLPGYNFTRLPIRVFLPGNDTAGEFISRPRSIALREFGPQNIIYHNGRKYRVCQLVVQDAESALTEAKLSIKSGYFLTGDQKDLEICPFSGLNLGDNANKEHLHDLMEMAESRAEEIDRISCEEEERVSRGYEIRTYFSVDGGHLDRVRKAVARTVQRKRPAQPALHSGGASGSRQPAMALRRRPKASPSA